MPNEDLPRCPDGHEPTHRTDGQGHWMVCGGGIGCWSGPSRGSKAEARAAWCERMGAGARPTDALAKGREIAREMGRACRRQHETDGLLMSDQGEIDAAAESIVSVWTDGFAEGYLDPQPCRNCHGERVETTPGASTRTAPAEKTCPDCCGRGES